MAKRTTLTDDLMQFASVEVLLDAVNVTTLVTSRLDTNMSVRGTMAWRLHRLDLRMPFSLASSHALAVGLSTRAGLTAVPTFTQRGCIQRWDAEWEAPAPGSIYTMFPVVDMFVPAVPLAAPAIHIYAATDVHLDELRGLKCAVRLGFTTEELDGDMRQELLDVWGWGS